MNVRLRKTFVWSCGLVYQNEFKVNLCQTDVVMVTTTQDVVEQNIAYERIKYWMHDVMTDCIMISQESALINQWQSLDQRLLIFPCEPVDQIIGMMFCSKLNAITENRITVTDVETRSMEGDNVIYLHNIDENLGSDLCKNGWWNDSRPIWITNNKPTRGKVVKLDHVPEWKDLDLDWADHAKKSDSVLFADFSKDDNK